MHSSQVHLAKLTSSISQLLKGYQFLPAAKQKESYEYLPYLSLLINHIYEL